MTGMAEIMPCKEITVLPERFADIGKAFQTNGNPLEHRHFRDFSLKSETHGKSNKVGAPHWGAMNFLLISLQRV